MKITCNRTTQQSKQEPVYYSFYEEYPIYEPAEGGYYYAGNSLTSSQQYDSFEEAFNAFLDEADFSECTGYISDLASAKKIFDSSTDGCVEVAWYSSHYIGDGQTLVIERTKGSQEAGQVPYE